MEDKFKGYPDLMLGIATAQNTVNTVPAIQLGVQEFCFVETEGASNAGWVKNATIALENRKIRVLPSIKPKVGSDHDIVRLKNLLAKKIPNKQGVFFNLGGGMKQHSIAVWEVFQERKNPDDWACYSNPQAGTIDLWHWKDGEIVMDSTPLDFDDELENLLKVFGFEIEDPGIKIFEAGKALWEEEVVNFLQYQEFREYVYRCYGSAVSENKGFHHLDEIKSMLNINKGNWSEDLKKTLVEKNKLQFRLLNKKPFFSLDSFNSYFIPQILKFIKEKVLIPEKMATGYFEFTNPELLNLLERKKINSKLSLDTRVLNEIFGVKIGDYFEKLVIKKVLKTLENPTHTVKRAYANVKIKSKDAKAEFDIVLQTSHGTFYTLDAKTFEFDKKDENSRKLNVLKSGGVFSAFIPVYLFYPEDMETDWYGDSVPTKIKNSALEGNQFMVFNNSPDIKEVHFQQNEIKINHLDNFLSILKLKK